MELLIGCIALFIVFRLPNLVNNGSASNQKFGDGKSTYDFKDYVNDKADRYNK